MASGCAMDGELRVETVGRLGGTYYVNSSVVLGSSFFFVILAFFFSGLRGKFIFHINLICEFLSPRWCVFFSSQFSGIRSVPGQRVPIIN